MLFCLLIVQRGLNQYRGTVGVFNNCNLPTRTKSYDLFSSKLLEQSPFNIYTILIVIRFVKYINNAQNVRIVHRSLFKSLYFCHYSFLYLSCRVYFITIKFSDDIEENPCPPSKSCDSLFICYWNVNSIPARNLIKLFLLRAYFSINKFDIKCLSETYFI